MSAPTEFDKKIKALIKAHRKSGAITLAQLNGVLPDDMSSPDKIEAAIAMIEEAGGAPGGETDRDFAAAR